MVPLGLGRVFHGPLFRTCLHAGPLSANYIGAQQLKESSQFYEASITCKDDRSFLVVEFVEFVGAIAPSACKRTHPFGQQ